MTGQDGRPVLRSYCWPRVEKHIQSHTAEQNDYSVYYSGLKDYLKNGKEICMKNIVTKLRTSTRNIQQYSICHLKARMWHLKNITYNFMNLENSTTP